MPCQKWQGKKEKKDLEKEIKCKNATVRIHGTVNHEKLEKAAIDFLKSVEFQRRKATKGGENVGR